MIIDTHSHLQFAAFEKDTDEVVKRTTSQGILAINVGTNYQTSLKGVEFAQKYGTGFFAAVGLHPLYAAQEFMKAKADPNEGIFESPEEFNVEKYRALAVSKSVVAIGEIGLDYYYKPKTSAKLAEFKAKQKKVFLQQLDLANELSLPVIFHCRMAHDEVIEILKNRSDAKKGVIHCFTGNLEQAQKYTAMGYLLGINGIIFKFNIDEVIKTIPLENLLLETDCPYLTPPQEGKKRNEPIFMNYTIQKIAELKNISVEEVKNQTTQNAKKLFSL